jgi:hypothetical protein
MSNLEFERSIALFCGLSTSLKEFWAWGCQKEEKMPKQAWGLAISCLFGCGRGK